MEDLILSFEDWQDKYGHEVLKIAQERGLVNEIDWHMGGAEEFDKEMYEEYCIQHMIHNQE
jgi:hypothetical protein